MRCNWNYLSPLKIEEPGEYKVHLHPYCGAPLYIEVSLSGGRHWIKNANTFEVVGTSSWTLETAKKKCRKYLKELNNESAK